jgi:tRNA(fMet)-specific endonuclease VapC
MIFLDTNVVIDLLNNRRPSVRGRYSEARRAGEHLALSAITLFELRYGVANSERIERNHRVLDALLGDGFEIVVFDEVDAAEAGALRAMLRREGASIGSYDLLIAAQARVRGATLITNNLREFERVPGLVVADWAG